ncbi:MULTISPECIES: hypothetical protein [Sorangium]|uniref:Uncharacterized protein n=1 Tax=Sorangium cellulosum TaxID=56 RepID=A0A4V0NFF1_SORCE|nr:MULTISPECIES: hypothetical protein [Sorangium]AUX29452.1 uncharacterized protein SOCE836_015420 [Sorangium cellulosum]WCQ88847.1 hypothetical protein NQZ70_01529 [Sorangium sp. Soce836]
MPKQPVQDPTDVDQLSAAQIEERVEKTLAHVEAIKALWPGIERLEEDRRKRSLGRSLAVLGPPLGKLFALLRPKDGKESVLARPFHVLGDQDDGDDPERFEVELLERRLKRALAEQKVADALEDLARHLDDDALATGEAVIGPGLAALDLARTIARQNATLRAVLAPVLDDFRAMTKQARKGKKPDAPKAEPPAPAPI